MPAWSASCSPTAPARSSRHPRRRTSACGGLLLGALLISADCLAINAAALADYLDGITSFSGRFEQERLDEDGELLDRASGSCRVKRPGRFSWHYESPYLQTIISNGESLWVYDADLEQVTLNPVGTAPAGSPAALLGLGHDVAQSYTIEAVSAPVDAANTALDWFRLTPRVSGGDFSAVMLAFGDGDVRVMRLVDNLGQTTLIRFNEVSRNTALSDELFEFSPPAGVDVIRGGAP